MSLPSTPYSRSMRSIFFLLLFASLRTSAQQHCAAHLGGSWFINCKSLVSYQGNDVVTFSDWSRPLESVNIDVYSTRHVLEAQVRAGKLVKGDAKRFAITAKKDEFSLVDKSTDRMICVLKALPPTTAHATCQVDVWLDLYVSGAGYFHCDPQTSNDPTVQMLRGATFQNSGSAISLY